MTPRAYSLCPPQPPGSAVKFLPSNHPSYTLKNAKRKGTSNATRPRSARPCCVGTSATFGEDSAGVPPTQFDAAGKGKCRRIDARLGPPNTCTLHSRGRHLRPRKRRERQELGHLIPGNDITSLQQM